MAAPRALPYERRVLRHMLESCDWLASRGLGGLKKLRELAAQREANDGGMGHPLVTLPKGWARGVPLHGAAMNGHVATTLPYLVETLRVPIDSVEPKTGNTAAHTSVIWGHVPSAAYLLARGARHDLENKDGLTLAPMARRRQQRLVAGTEAERAYYVRHGVPLDQLVAEGERLVRMLDGVEAAGSFDAWARPRAARPIVAAAAPWFIAADRRFDLAVLRAGCVARDIRTFEAAAAPAKKGPSKKKLAKMVAEAEATARAAAEAELRRADPPLAIALAAAGLEDEHFARALRWLNAATVDDARDLDRNEVARVDGLGSAERRRLWLFCSEAAAKRSEAVDAVQRAAREAVATPPPAPTRLDPRSSLALHPDLPVGCFELVCRFAYSARRPDCSGEPVTDAAVLEAVAHMKI